MKLISLSTSGIGALKSQTITLDPSLNVITGINGSGKSTLLGSFHDVMHALCFKPGEFFLKDSINGLSKSPYIEFIVDTGLNIPDEQPVATNRKGLRIRTVANKLTVRYDHNGKPGRLSVTGDGDMIPNEAFRSEHWMNLWNYIPEGEDQFNGQICYISSNRGYVYNAPHEQKTNRGYRGIHTPERFIRIRQLLDLMHNLDGSLEAVLSKNLERFFKGIASVRKVRSGIGNNLRLADVSTLGKVHEVVIFPRFGGPPDKQHTLLQRGIQT